MTEGSAGNGLLSTVTSGKDDASTDNSPGATTATSSGQSLAVHVSHSSARQQQTGADSSDAGSQSAAASRVGTPTRQYASINILPSPQDRARKTGAIAAATAPIASLVSPILNHAVLDDAGASAPLTGGSGVQSSAKMSFESRSRASTASQQGNGADGDESVPFTYSGVFSRHVWHDKSAESNGTSATAASASGNEDSTGFSGKHAAGGTAHGHSGLHEASSELMSGHMPRSALSAQQQSSDEESDSEEDDSGGESDTESYEGMAVDDINETYDQSLPEYVPNPDPYTQSIYLEEEGIAVSISICHP
ncbi:hypothetical protein GQ54DRAFT_53273 [Martensiomyces pterosporus]|nr:hypothetical protein GQ54DRAFT_53273 [Martensiomyces pterosporus]